LAINGTPTVNINYQQHPMQPVPNKYPLYSVDVDVKEFPVNYNYIIDYGNGNAEQEEFTRQRSKEDKPLNEFFGRSITVKEHPLLPKAFEEFPYAKKSKLYDGKFSINNIIVIIIIIVIIVIIIIIVIIMIIIVIIIVIIVIVVIVVVVVVVVEIVK